MSTILLLAGLLQAEKMIVLPPISIRASLPIREAPALDDPNRPSPLALPPRPDKPLPPRVLIPTAEHRGACPRPGAICVAPWGGATYLDQHKGSKGERLMVLERGIQLAANMTGTPAGKNQPWQVEMVAHLKAPATGEPIIVAAFDHCDREGIARREALRIWDVATPPTRTLAMRFALEPEDGFRTSHGYLVQVVQLGKRGPRVLAEGDVHLE
jgi:hypothetical protein